MLKAKMSDLIKATDLKYKRKTGECTVKYMIYCSSPVVLTVCNYIILQDWKVSIKMVCFPLQSTIVEISRTTHLSIAKSAFSRLSSAVFKDIQKLDLAESSFEFENQNYIGRHGPVTTVSISLAIQRFSQYLVSLTPLS